MQDLKVSIIQCELIWEDTKLNLQNFDRLIDQISEETNLIVLPEVFNTGFTVNAEKYAEDETGEVLSWMQKKANNKNCVICGSLLFKENANYYNRLIWMQPNGEYQHYSKRHIFHIGAESESIKPGRKKLITNYKNWHFNPLICYDLRFPVWSKNKFEKGQFEYDVLIYVANWPASRAYPWKQLLIARAIENQAYVIGVNRIGTDGQGLNYQGDSIIIDPKGNILINAPALTEAVITTNLSAEMILNFRNKFNVGPDWDKFHITE